MSVRQEICMLASGNQSARGVLFWSVVTGMSTFATLLRYVSVTFQTTTQETDPQEGPNPRWGQSFSFEVDGPVDTEFSVDLLRQITDEVHIDLFDHIEKDAELDNRLTSVEVSLCSAYVLALHSWNHTFQDV